MTNTQDYVKNVERLINLVHDVTYQLISQDNQEEKKAMVTQLLEISRAIENLEKKNIFIPEVLRAEKTRLAAAVGHQSEAFLSLTKLTEGLGEIVQIAKLHLSSKTITRTKRQSGRPRSRTPKTSNKVLRELIIEALRLSGGSAPKKEVHKYIEHSLQGKFLPGDMDRRESTRNFVWENNTDWERFAMVQEGILKKGSPSGIWELAEDYQ